VLSIGFPEFLLVALVIVIFVGPERLPQLARWLGRMTARGRQMFLEVQRELERNAELQEIRKTGVELREDISGVVQEFGKMSDELTDDMKRLGDELSVKSPQKGQNAKPADAEMDPGSEDHFQDEVEILRQSRNARSAPEGSGEDHG
jgi:sec-independent protein translocase protein TatB